MQIDRYNHLLFPRDAHSGTSNNNPAAAGKDASSSAAGGASGVLAKPQAGAPASLAARVTQRPDSVVLNIQWPDGDIANSPDPGVYTDGRKTVVSGETDTGAMARDHRLAMDRSAGTFTQISLNKDGVLVANKAQPASAHDNQPDFVALAVSAMREYSDEHDRQKVRTTTEIATAEAPTETHWSAFKRLQQIAAKLNVFA
jgi:hypothetical protein